MCEEMNKNSGLNCMSSAETFFNVILKINSIAIIIVIISDFLFKKHHLSIKDLPADCLGALDTRRFKPGSTIFTMRKIPHRIATHNENGDIC